MSTRLLRCVLAIGALAAFLKPASASAADAYHATTSEAGATYHPDHASKATRHQIAAERIQAIRHRSWNTGMSRGAR